MPLEELRRTLRLRPFRPFRLFVTEGGPYDVRHPELCVPGSRSVFVGIPAPSQTEPIYDDFAIIDLIHITRIEQIHGSSKGRIFNALVHF